ncbi:MAG: hypothetical protein GEV04_23755, partial [Actinophytocola sp.]|nr:hypothetical protein [Actinophytocola sp.]
MVIMDDNDAGGQRDWRGGRQDEGRSWALLGGFREQFYGSLQRRSDALFELADAVLCAPGRVTDLARLSLEPVHRRGHGALYDALNAGRVDTERLGQLVAGLSVPRMPGPDGRDRIVLAVDASSWLRPDAATSPDRSFCHTYPRGQGQAQMIPGWKYLWIAALAPGGLFKTQFEEVETDGRSEGVEKRDEGSPIIGEQDLPGLEVRNRTLDGSANGTDLVVVFMFTNVEFTVLWLLDRRDVARPLKSLVCDNGSGKVENLL